MVGLDAEGLGDQRAFLLLDPRLRASQWRRPGDSLQGTSRTRGCPWLAMITSSPAKAAFTSLESWFLASSKFSWTALRSLWPTRPI